MVTEKAIEMARLKIGVLCYEEHISRQDEFAQGKLTGLFEALVWVVKGNPRDADQDGVKMAKEVFGVDLR